MWCTQCRTAFSWTTGRVVNGRVHNPHFFEFQNQEHVARNLDDIPCGGLPNYYEVVTALQVQNCAGEMRTQITSAYRLVVEIEDVHTHRFPTDAVNEVHNEQQRVSYILGDIDEVSFSNSIQRREKKMELKRSIGLILHMFVCTVSDWMRQLVLGSLPVETLVCTLERLRLYANTHLSTIAVNFKCRSVLLRDDYVLVSSGNADTLNDTAAS